MRLAPSQSVSFSQCSDIVHVSWNRRAVIVSTLLSEGKSQRFACLDVNDPAAWLIAREFKVDRARRRDSHPC